MADNSMESSGEKLAGSARRLERSTERVQEYADRRTELAADRTVFAAERTYAAWVRTGLVALASGIGSRKLLAGLLPDLLVQLTASALVLFSAFCFAAGVWRDLKPGAPPPRPDVAHLHPVVLIAVNGFLAVVALAVLAAIWFGRTPEP